MTNKLLNIIFIFLLSFTGKSQTPFSSWEIGVFGGGSYYLGEINQSHFTPMNLAFGPIIRYNYDQRLNVKFALTFGTIQGKDENSSSSFNTDRNVSFKSDLMEISSVLEFNFFPFSSLDPKSHLITPYGYLGFAYLNHNPKINSNGRGYNGDLETEGKSYSKHLLTIPMGLGLKFRMNRFGITLDWGIRKTFTDYLDDVSTFYLPINSSGSNTQQDIGNLTQYSDVSDFKRGDKYSKDWYIFTGITFFVNLSKQDICRSFN
tara:strand:+ start:56 stop:838 length:783 start_codon:yes stop_codon:yes gene_type:complete